MRGRPRKVTPGMKIVGRKRKLTDEQLAIIRSWKSLPELAKEWGVSRSAINWARRHTYKSEWRRGKGLSQTTASNARNYAYKQRRA